MTRPELLVAYLDGPRLLRDAVAGMTPAQLDARPVPGKMTTRELVCHVADFEPVYADRMKRTLAEDRPPLPGGDPDAWMRALAYSDRDLAEEFAVIESVRLQMARILRSVPDAAWTRVGVHSEAGELTLADLLRRIVHHVPHHLTFVAEKRLALGC